MLIHATCIDELLGHILHTSLWRDDFIWITKNELFLNKANFSEKGYLCTYLQNPNKATASSDKRKMNVNNCMNLSNDKLEEVTEAKENLVAQRDGHL
jgi:hypothetical protein